MSRVINAFFRLLESVMVVCLGAMCVMVFANVVLRHFFDSGINISEEVSRFMFIWLTFIGAIVAMRENAHLGMDMVVRRLRPGARRVAMMLSQALVLSCCAVLLWGLLRQHAINAANIGLVTGVSLAFVYSVAYLCAAAIGLMACANIWRLWRGQPLGGHGLQPHE